MDTAAPAPVYFRNRISTGAPVCTTSPAGVSPGSATAPTSNQILGIVNATNGVAGATNAVTLFGPGIIGVSAGGTSITGTTLSAGTNVTTSGTISGSAVLYVCTDGISVTLPAATTKGQIVILIDGSTTVSDGITPVAGSGDSLRGASGGGDSAGASFFFVSDGNHHWVNVGPQ